MVSFALDPIFVIAIEIVRNDEHKKMRKIKKLLNLLCIVYELFTIIKHIPQPEIYDINTLVNVYVDLVIFTRIAGTS